MHAVRRQSELSFNKHSKHGAVVRQSACCVFCFFFPKKPKGLEGTLTNQVLHVASQPVSRRFLVTFARWRSLHLLNAFFGFLGRFLCGARVSSRAATAGRLASHTSVARKS